MLPAAVEPNVGVEAHASSADVLRRLALSMGKAQESQEAIDPIPGPMRTQKLRRALADQEETGVVSAPVSAFSLASTWSDMCAYAAANDLNSMVANQSFVNTLYEKQMGLESDRAIVCYEHIVDKIHDYYGLSSMQRRQTLKNLHEPKYTLTTLQTFFDETREPNGMSFVPGIRGGSPSSDVVAIGLTGPYPVPPPRGRPSTPSVFDAGSSRAASLPPGLPAPMASQALAPSPTGLANRQKRSAS